MNQYSIHEDRDNAIRRSNRQSFLRTSIAAESKKTISVLILCYNDTEQFFRQIDRLEKEPSRDRFTITAVQNSDKEASLQKFDEQIKNYADINVLYPVMNLGSAGGYALGQEYCIHHKYEHVIMLEDDVELLERDTISAMIEHIQSKKDVIFIDHPINAGGDHSRYVQIGCYPTSLLQSAGIIDPRYYFRAEDLERAKRIEKNIKSGRYTKKIAPRGYYHPYLKPINNSGSWIYFSVRNQLRSYLKHRQGYLQLVASLTQYLSFGIFTLLRTGKAGIVKCVLAGLKDGISSYKTLEYNRKMISALSAYKKMELSDLGFTMKSGGMNEIKQGVNRTHFLATTTISTQDRMNMVKYTGRLIICGGFQPVWGGIISLMKQVFIIESLRRDTQTVSGKLISQRFGGRLLNFLLFLPASLLGCIAIVIYSIVFLGVSYLRK